MEGVRCVTLQPAAITDHKMLISILSARNEYDKYLKVRRTTNSVNLIHSHVACVHCVIIFVSYFSLEFSPDGSHNFSTELLG